MPVHDAPLSSAMGAYVNGPLWARDVRTIEGRKLKGIVIKYR
ncbi:hypothetical protein ACM1ZW_20605 [Pseudomonas sp. NFX71]